MSLMMTKIRQEHTNVYWEPFATSTPLKRLPDCLKINEPQKQIQKSTDCLNVLLKKGCNFSNVIPNRETIEAKIGGSKKSLKPKSPFYYDLTSSSDEDDSKENNKRPIIKINSVNVNKTKSLLINEGCEKEEEEEVLSKKIDSYKSKSTNSPVKKTPTHLSRLKNRCSQAEVKRPKRTQNRTVCTTLQKMEAESKNFVPVENKNEVKKVRGKTKCKKYKSSSSSNEGLTSLNNQSKGSGNENIKESTNGDQANTGSLDVKDTNEKTFVKLNSELPKLSQLKRKSTKVLIVTPVKKIKTKSKGNEKEQPILGSIENKRLSLVWEKEKNLSHQLFSDSAEQELINNLDLSTVDIKEVNLHSTSQNQRKSMISKGCKAKPKTNQLTEVKQERPSRRRQAPKEFWLPDNQSEEFKQSQNEKKPKEQSKVSSAAFKNSEPKLKTKGVKEKERLLDVTNEEKKMPDGIGEASMSKQTVENSVTEMEKDKNEEDPVHDDEKDKKDKDPDHDCKKKPTPANEKQKKEKEDKESRKLNVDPSSFPVFKQLNEIQCKEGAHLGCFTSECWSVKNFKCGVFTLKTGSRLSNRTKHSNSYFGGVLIKGSLKMKIGGRECELKEGGMIFVPPLTDWEAINTCDSKSIVYYWCGRFKT